MNDAMRLFRRHYYADTTVPWRSDTGVTASGKALVFRNFYMQAGDIAQARVVDDGRTVPCMVIATNVGNCVISSEMKVFLPEALSGLLHITNGSTIKYDDLVRLLGGDCGSVNIGHRLSRIEHLNNHLPVWMKDAYLVSGFSARQPATVQGPMPLIYVLDKPLEELRHLPGEQAFGIRAIAAAEINGVAVSAADTDAFRRIQHYIDDMNAGGAYAGQSWYITRNFDKKFMISARLMSPSASRRGTILGEFNSPTMLPGTIVTGFRKFLKKHEDAAFAGEEKLFAEIHAELKRLDRISVGT